MATSLKSYLGPVRDYLLGNEQTITAQTVVARAGGRIGELTRGYIEERRPSQVGDMIREEYRELTNPDGVRKALKIIGLSALVFGALM